mmetsp:Transcript_23364/g.46449  ORF Transcript_23364/g.46449 Transcript_23364/m.46449 type:complete len:216 (-) Transcript_23364:1289-1936(-)
MSRAESDCVLDFSLKALLAVSLAFASMVRHCAPCSLRCRTHFCTTFTARFLARSERRANAVRRRAWKTTAACRMALNPFVCLRVRDMAWMNAAALCKTNRRRRAATMRRKERVLTIESILSSNNISCSCTRHCVCGLVLPPPTPLPAAAMFFFRSPPLAPPFADDDALAMGFDISASPLVSALFFSESATATRAVDILRSAPANKSPIDPRRDLP